MANFDRAGRIFEIGPKTRSDCFIAEHGVPLWNRRPVDPDDVDGLVRGYVRCEVEAAHCEQEGIRAKNPRAFGRLARSAWHSVFDRTLLDLALFGALSSATPVVCRRPFGNSVDSTEFLRWDDPYHST
jgi:hypothetical protein